MAIAAAAQPAAATAAWTHSGTGTPTAKAVSMPTGATPTASVSNRSVTVSWSASTMPGGGAVSGYLVKRYDTNGNAQTIGSGCSGTIAALTCTETSVPGGTWRYTVTPVKNNWVGTEGSQSSNATVASPSLTFSSSTTVTALPTTLNGTIAAFVGGQTVTFRLDNPSTGTVLSGTLSPSPVPSGGGANVTVTIPTGTSDGSHTVYVVGSGGDVASGAITVMVGATNVAGGYNYVWTNTSPYNNPPSGQKALVVELRWDASAEGSVTGYEVVRSGSTVCGGSTSLATECIDLNPASSGTSTYTLKTWYRDSSGNLQSISTTYNVTAPGAGAFPTQYWHTSGTSISTTKCLPTSSVGSGIRRDTPSTYVPGTEQTFSSSAGGNGFVGCMPPFTQTVTMSASTTGMQVSAYFRNAGTGTVGCNIGWQVYKNGSVVNGVAGTGFGGGPANIVIPPNQTQPTLVTANLGATAQTFVATDQLSLVIAGFTANTSSSKCTSTTLYYNSSARPVSTVLPLTGSGGGGAPLSQPAAPTGLTVSVNPTDGTRTLTWNAATGTPAPDFYRIYRDGQKYVNRVDTTGDTGSATVSWTDTASGGTSHTYYVTTVADTMAESASMASVTG
jgi:hypothetical protein